MHFVSLNSLSLSQAFSFISRCKFANCKVIESTEQWGHLGLPGHHGGNSWARPPLSASPSGLSAGWQGRRAGRLRLRQVVFWWAPDISDICVTSLDMTITKIYSIAWTPVVSRPWPRFSARNLYWAVRLWLSSTWRQETQTVWEQGSSLGQCSDPSYPHRQVVQVRKVSLKSS